MSNILWKNIHLCLPKFRCLPSALSPPPTNDQEEEESEAQNLLEINPTNAAMIKNFNSIYDIASASTSKSLTFSTEENFFSSSDDSDIDIDSVPDFSTIFASQRFFFSSPGKSNSIIESPEIRQPPPPENDKLVSGGVAIQTYSPDPYADFRRSMQEMVEAHELRDVKADWEFLHELLLCYLSLNPKQTHKTIIAAFTDLIISLMASTPKADRSHRTTDVGHHCTSSRL